MRRITAKMVFRLTISFGLFSSVAWAQSGACDTSLKPASNNPNQYRMLEQDPFRCEGMYTNQVAATGSILLVTLIKGTSQLDPHTGKVSASWQNPSSGETRLRGYSLRDTTYYRMDSRLPAGRSNYTWPLAIPSSVGLMMGELGLVAWTPADVFSDKRDVYLPLALTAGPPEKKVTASFWTPTGLNKVTLRISLLKGKSNSQHITDLVKPGQYPPRRRIDFVMDGLATPGFYELTISGEDVSRQPWSDSYIIYNP